LRSGLWTAGLCGVVLAACTSAGAQGRRGVHIRTPRNPGRISQLGGPVRQYGARAYGLGSLGGGPSAGGAEALRSDITGAPLAVQSPLTRPGSSPLGSPGTAAGAAPGVGALPGTTGRPGTARARPQLGVAGPVPLVGQDARALGGYEIRRAILTANPALSVANRYLQSVGPSELAARPQANKPITSLVPSRRGVYAMLLALGEKAFRRGQTTASSSDFDVAFSYFERASVIAPHAPETLVSLTHARFATSSVAYAAAAHYLRQALKYLPELPLVPLRPKLFYGSDTAAASRYVRHLARLEKHLADMPDDVDALLLLAYFRWFSGLTNDARVALATAMTIAVEDNDKDTVEAVDTFWAGMVRSGKASGKLLPAAVTRDGRAADTVP